MRWPINLKNSFGQFHIATLWPARDSVADASGRGLATVPRQTSSICWRSCAIARWGTPEWIPAL